MAPSILNSLLPSKFLGYFPLYIGVELILGFAIINKASGIYGILSIFTGHPINFWQWLYYTLSLVALPVYTTALTHLQTRPSNVRKISLACIVYVVDSIVGLLFTLYFTNFWFENEENSTTQAPASTTGKTSQSASPQRELFLTIAGTISLTILRFYFMFAIISFTRTLIKQTQGQRLVAEDEEEDINGEGKLAKLKAKIIEFEIRATEYLSDFFKQ